MTDWEQGIQALRQGRLHEAADRLGAAAADQERTVTVSARFSTLAHLGAALYALGRTSDAVTAFEGALALSPPPAPAELQVNLIHAYLAAGRQEEARQTLKQTLQEYPGYLEAQMLLERLSRHDETAPLTGAALGETPSGVLHYLRTLTFSAVASGGYDPAQVRLALSQIERHLEFLVFQIVSRDETIARLEGELQDAQAASKLAHDTKTPNESGDAPPLTPLEALLRQKPRPSP